MFNINTEAYENDNNINDYFIAEDSDWYEPVHHQYLDETSDDIYHVECLRKVTAIQYNC